MSARPGATPTGVLCVLGVLALVAVAGCSGDGRELADPVFPPPAVVDTTLAAVPAPTLPEEPAEPAAESTAEPVAASDPMADSDFGTLSSGIVIDQLSSPANATVEIRGWAAAASDPITVDGDPADVLEFERSRDGSFVARVWVDEEGAHTVCVADVCGRVYTLAADADSPEEVVAKIEEAIPLALAVFPLEERFPDWSVEIGGALGGTGGSTDVDARTVVVYRNRGRTVEEFVRTLLHEFGHVVDAELLDDADRAAYAAYAGFPADAVWRDPEARRLSDWAQQPAEDFAEVLVAHWTDGADQPRTRDPVDRAWIDGALAAVGLDPADL